MGQIVNVCRGQKTTVNQIYGFIVSALGKEVEPNYKSEESLWDSYPQLFEVQYPLSRKFVTSETLKGGIGDNSKMLKLIGGYQFESIDDQIFEIAQNAFSRLQKAD
jgi:hypothetical protein